LSGFGALTVRTLADAKHVVYAGMRGMTGRNEQSAAAARAYADEQGVTLRPIEMDVSDQDSVDQAVASVLAEAGRIDVLIHNAGHMVLGPTEAFTPEQVAEVYDTNVLSTQRVNRAALPHMRQRGDGLVVWVGSSSSRGGTPPYLGPYFAAKAAEDALAVSYAAELTRFGIETTVEVQRRLTSGHCCLTTTAARLTICLRNTRLSDVSGRAMRRPLVELADLGPGYWISVVSSSVELC